jgi:predicted nucleic acid-binding protein
VKFDFERDPRDAKFTELAIAGAATHLITLDRDLLSLPTARTSAGQRFRQRLRRAVVQQPAQFIRLNGIAMGLE